MLEISFVYSYLHPHPLAVSTALVDRVSNLSSHIHVKLSRMSSVAQLAC